MDDRGLLCFVSENALRRHRDYENSLRYAEELLRKGARYDDRTLIQLYAKRHREDTAELLRRAILCEAHRLYFSSFAEYPTVSDAFCRRFGGMTSFYQRLKEEALSATHFLYIGTDKRGGVLCSTEPDVFLRASRMPCLCIDVCEHAYFLDYGFDRDAYIRAAVAHLDVGRLLTSSE